MPILKAATAPNGITVGYHKASKVIVDLVTGLAEIHVQSFTNEAAYLDKLPIAWMWAPMEAPASVLSGGGSVLDDVEVLLTTDAGSPFRGGTRTFDATDSLDSLKARKRAEITRARLAADADHFAYQGKSIRTADKDMTDLLVADARMRKGMPANWPGGWKAIDNSYVPIASVTEWDAFFVAMYDAGIDNYNLSQQLKADIEAATTAADLEFVRWP